MTAIKSKRRMRAVSCVAVLGAAVLGGCSSAKLRCEPDIFVSEARHLSADYIELQDKLLVEVNTDGYRIDQVWITTPGGDVKPVQIEYETGRRGGTGFGIGVGAGSDGSGVGVGVGTDTGGYGYITGNTKLYFERAAVGAPPWTMPIKLMGLARTTIVLTPREP
jgi:hypothetical protein